MKQEWNIRPATDKDWPGIWEIFRDVISHGDTYTYAPDFTEEQAKNIWIVNGCHGYVVTHGDQIVGTFTIRTNKPGFGNHIANAGYMVSPAARGQGIAGKMCEHSMQQARAAGFTAMQFNFVVSTNTTAVRLWQRLGFNIVGQVPGAFRHAVHGPTDIYVMHRHL